jgi:hypothetical protein
LETIFRRAAFCCFGDISLEWAAVSQVASGFLGLLRSSAICRYPRCSVEWSSRPPFADIHVAQWNGRIASISILSKEVTVITDSF